MNVNKQVQAYIDNSIACAQCKRMKPKEEFRAKSNFKSNRSRICKACEEAQAFTNHFKPNQ